ncbi:hypothetical protein ABK040_004566 [Willaertia magna]
MVRTKQAERRNPNEPIIPKKHFKIPKLTNDANNDIPFQFYLQNQQVTNLLLQNYTLQNNNLQNNKMISTDIWFNEIIYFLINDLKSILNYSCEKGDEDDGFYLYDLEFNNKLTDYNTPLICVYNDLFDSGKRLNGEDEEGKKGSINIDNGGSFYCYLFGRENSLPIDVEFTVSQQYSYIECEDDEKSLQPNHYSRKLLCEIISYNDSNEKKIPIFELITDNTTDKYSLYYLYEYFRMTLILLGKFEELKELENIYEEVKENKEKYFELTNKIEELNSQYHLTNLLKDQFNNLHFGMDYQIAPYFGFCREFVDIHSILKKN